MKNKLPDGWKINHLSDICEIIMGQSPPGNSYNIAGSGTPFFQGKAEFGNKYPTIKKWTTQPSKIAKSRTILMSVRAPVGDINYCDVECCIGRGLASIKPSSNLDLHYLYFYLSNIKEKISNLGTGSTFKAITGQQLKTISIIVPPLQTQQKIVSILEKAKKANEWRKDADELTKDFLKSVFLEMFGDERKNTKMFEIKGFLDVFNTTTGKLDSNASVKNGKYPFFTCSQETFQIDNYSFDCEALLLAGNNAAAKYSVKYYKGKFDAYQRTYVLRLKDNNDLYRFYHYQLEQKLGELQNKSIGTNTKYLTLGILRNIKMICPPIVLQQKFAAIVEWVEALKSHQKHSKEQIDNLFGALMQKAFKGELI